MAEADRTRLDRPTPPRRWRQARGVAGLVDRSTGQPVNRCDRSTGQRCGHHGSDWLTARDESAATGPARTPLVDRGRTWLCQRLIHTKIARRASARIMLVNRLRRSWRGASAGGPTAPRARSGCGCAAGAAPFRLQSIELGTPAPASPGFGSVKGLALLVDERNILGILLGMIVPMDRP
jgi:hypothetical protein